MNKKQLLSIAMLISVVGINATTERLLPAMDRYVANQKVAAQKLAQQRAAFEATLPGSGAASSAGANAKTFKDAAEARAAAIAEKAAGNVDEKGMFTNAWNGVKAFPGLAYTTVRTHSGNAYEFAKENPTTSAIRGGAVLGAGYVVYRQAGNVWNKIKENPKTTAAFVAGVALGYYKGDVALTAVKGLVGKLPEVSTPGFVNTGLDYAKGAGSTALSYVPSTPEFAKGAGSTALSYVPSTPGFVNTGLGYVKGAGLTALDSVTSNPYTSAAYAAFGAQQVADYVGLAGSEEEETATEIEIGTDAHRDMLKLNKTNLVQTAKFKALTSIEQIVVVKELINWLNGEEGKDCQGFLYIDAANRLLSEVQAS